MGAALDSSKVGRAGEFFVAYVLERNGIQCHHVDLDGSDLWCQLENGKMFTVQVKSATAPFRRKDRRIKSGLTRWVYGFCLTTAKKADFTIYLALDQERFIVETAEQVGTKRSIQITPKTFTTTKMVEGIDLLKGLVCGDDS